MIGYRQMPLATGDIITPHEINAEFQALAGEMNGGLDRENITAGMLTIGELDNGSVGGLAFGEVHQSDDITSYGIALQSFWHLVLTETVDGRNNRAFIDAALTLDISSASYLSFSVGILVDDRCVAETGFNGNPTNPPFDRLTKEIRAAPRLSHGQHTISLAVRTPSLVSYDHIMSDLLIISRIR